MRANVYLLLTIVCLFSSCSMSDYTEEMYGGYFYVREGGDYNFIINHSKGKPAVWADITDYSYNRDFILVKQHPIMKYHIIMLAFEIRGEDSIFRNNTIEDIKRSNEIADSIINTNAFYTKIFARIENYWIIDVKLDSLHGPFSQSEYLQMRQTIGIMDRLKLKFEK